MSSQSLNELLVVDGIEVDAKDANNPRSLINITPTNVANAIKAIPEEFFALTEIELAEVAKADLVENRLRHSWWIEYSMAQQASRRMNMANVYAGVCTVEYWKKNVITNSYKMAYIITPPPNYRVTMAELLTLGLNKIREIVTLPLIDEKGRVNTRLADVQAKLVQDIINRVHGQVIQRVEVKSQNMNVNIDKQIGPTDGPQDLDQQIENLEKELQAPHGSIRDVKSEEENS